MFEAVLAEVRAMLLDGLTSKVHVRSSVYVVYN